jgi:methylated-DNA-[protein]-cysteine S-methyltransferase
MKFYEKVYELLRKIPKGKVTTYKIIANKLNSNAYRAVGNACKRNKFLYKIPCYKVVKSDGSVGEYSKGKRKKILLLRKEGIKISNGKILDFEKVLFKYE